MPKKDFVQIYLTATPELYKLLDRDAKKVGISVPNFIRMLLSAKYTLDVAVKEL